MTHQLLSTKPSTKMSEVYRKPGGTLDMQDTLKYTPQNSLAMQKSPLNKDFVLLF